MKVLLISREFPFGRNAKFGGGGSHVFYLAWALASQGAKVAILAFEGASLSDSPLAGLGSIQVHSADFDSGDDPIPLAALRKAVEICGSFRPDVIHGHHLTGAFIALATSVNTNIPAVVTIHKPPRLAHEEFAASIPLPLRDRFYTLWQLLATDSRICAHVAYSRIYQLENTNIGVPKRKLNLIFHGVPDRFLKKKAHRVPRPSWGISPEHTVVLCPMRLEKPGVDTFIRAAARIKDDARLKHLHLRMVLTGTRVVDPPVHNAADETYRMARSLGLTTDLLLMKNFTLRQMWTLLARAQVCVLPSLREGFSIVLLEAMALGALCANVSETVTPREISEQGGEGIRDNHGRSRDVWGCQGSGRGAAQRA